MTKHILPLVLILLFLFSCNTGQVQQKNYQLVKTGSLIAPPDNMPAGDYTTGAYYTTLVEMDSIKNFPYDYALYFSTDHSNGKGGIWLYLCKGEPGYASNWISYDDALADGNFDYLKNKPSQNPVYIDSIRGYQTETPHANIVNGQVFLTYHNSLLYKEYQATMLATSSDGVNFKRISNNDSAIILKPRKHMTHTGYFRWGKNIFSKVDYKYIGYSLYKGTLDYCSVMWGSNNAIEWEELKIFNSWRTDIAVPDSGIFMIWHEIDPNSIRKINNNEYVAITSCGSRAAGSGTRKNELYEIYLGDDGCSITRMSRKILANGSRFAEDSEELAEPSITLLDDSIHMVYVGAGNQGRKNTVMGAVGKFYKNTKLPPKLPADKKQYHYLSEDEFKVGWERYKQNLLFD